MTYRCGVRMIESMGNTELKIDNNTCTLYRLHEANLCVIDFGCKGARRAMSLLRSNLLERQLYGSIVGGSAIFNDCLDDSMSIVPKIIYKYGAPDFALRTQGTSRSVARG